MAWRVMMPKKISTRFSHEPDVGVKCRVIRGFFASQALHVGVLVRGVVVAHHVQLAARVFLGDLLEELQELGVAVPVVAGVGDLAGGDFQGGEQRGGAVAHVVVGGLSGSPGRIGRIGAVRFRAWIWVFSPTHTHHRVLGRVQVQARRCRGPWPPVADRWRT